MSFFRPRYRNLLLLAAVLAPALAHAAPYTTTRYIRIDLKTDTGYSYDENFNRLPDSPQRPGASQETLPEGVTRWFLGADVDVIKRHPDGRLEVVSHKPAYSQLPHHYIFTYQTSSRPAKDECGILPLAVGRDLLDLRFPAGYAFAMKGGTLGGLDFHWTNSANVPETEELYVRFNMHWDEGTTRYRDFNITWVGLNPCRDWEVYTGSWSETDAAARQKIFEQCLNPDCDYSDTHVHVNGHDQLAAYMVEFQKNVPGGRFVTTEFAEHHGRSLAHWNLVVGEDKVVGKGASFGQYHADGRLKQMTGFFLPFGDN